MIDDFYSKQNGYKMRLISLENCNDDNVIGIDKNFTATLSSDCILTTAGCVTAKAFKKAKVSTRAMEHSRQT